MATVGFVLGASFLAAAVGVGAFLAVSAVVSAVTEAYPVPAPRQELKESAA